MKKGLSDFFRERNVKEEDFFRYMLIFLALLLGIFVRWNYISGSSYPMNDGGLFYKMTEDLINNDLMLPVYTSYNIDNIPFAYPPLAFYLAAIFHLVTKISLLNIYKILPFILTVGTMPALYYFALKIFDDKLLASLSLFFFAMLPRAFEWFVMGGGMTRSLGFLLAILAIGSIWDLFTGNHNWKNVISIAVLSSATILSHPETALFVIFCAILFFIYHRPQWKNLKYSLAVAIMVVILSTPWLVSIVGTHGLGPFMGAGSTGHENWFKISTLLTLNFGLENSYFLTVFGLFSLIAVFIRRDRLTYFLYGSLIFGYIVFPRSGPNLITIFVAPLAALGLREFLMLAGAATKNTESFLEILEINWKSRSLFIFMMVYLLLGAATYKYTHGKMNIQLTDDIVHTYRWIENNTEVDDVIVFYPTNEEGRFWWNDFIAEWFPALTSRQNLTTVQGYEWIPDKYQDKVWNYTYLWTCKDIAIDCINTWESHNGIKIDYLVIIDAPKRPDLVNNLVVDNQYHVVSAKEPLIVLEKE